MSTEEIYSSSEEDEIVYLDANDDLDECEFGVRACREHPIPMCWNNDFVTAQINQCDMIMDCETCEARQVAVWVITTDESFLYGQLTKYLMCVECLLGTFYNCEDWTQCFLHHREMNWWFRRRSVLRIKRANK